MFQCQILHCHVINDVVLKSVEKRSKSCQFHTAKRCVTPRLMDKEKKLINRTSICNIIYVQWSCLLYLRVTSFPHLWLALVFFCLLLITWQKSFYKDFSYLLPYSEYCSPVSCTVTARVCVCILGGLWVMKGNTIIKAHLNLFTVIMKLKSLQVRPPEHTQQETREQHPDT